MSYKAPTTKVEPKADLLTPRVQALVGEILTEASREDSNPLSDYLDMLQTSPIVGPSIELKILLALGMLGEYSNAEEKYEGHIRRCFELMRGSLKLAVAELLCVGPLGYACAEWAPIQIEGKWMLDAIQILDPRKYRFRGKRGAIDDLLYAGDTGDIAVPYDRVIHLVNQAHLSFGSPYGVAECKRALSAYKAWKIVIAAALIAAKRRGEPILVGYAEPDQQVQIGTEEDGTPIYISAPQALLQSLQELENNSVAATSIANKIELLEAAEGTLILDALKVLERYQLMAFLIPESILSATGVGDSNLNTGHRTILHLTVEATIEQIKERLIEDVVRPLLIWEFGENVEDFGSFPSPKQHEEGGIDTLNAIIDAVFNGAFSAADLDVINRMRQLAGLPTVTEIAEQLDAAPTDVDDGAEQDDEIDGEGDSGVDAGAIQFAARRRPRKGRKRGKGKKNCTKGINCGGTCISAKKNCRKDNPSEKVKAKAKSPKRTKGGGGGGADQTDAATKEINDLIKSYKPVSPGEADNIAQGRPPRALTETGEMLYRYSEAVQTPSGSTSQRKLKQGFEQSTQAESVYNGQLALIYSDNGTLKAVGEHSGNIHASALAAGGKNARALSVQIGSNPEAINVAKKLDVPDTDPVFFKKSSDPKAFDQGAMLYLYSSDITKPSKAKGHKGSQKDVDEAAIAVLKSNTDMPAPVVVRQIGVGRNARYEVIGGNFAYDVAQRAKLERYYAVIAEFVPEDRAQFAARRRPRKGRKRGKGKKNCNKGINCGGTCISAKKTCKKDNPSEAVKAKAKAPKKSKGGGGGGGEAEKMPDWKSVLSKEEIEEFNEMLAPGLDFDLAGAQEFVRSAKAKLNAGTGSNKAIDSDLVVGRDGLKGFGAADLNAALDSIPNASKRISQLRQFVNDQKIKVAFNDRLLEGRGAEDTAKLAKTLGVDPYYVAAKSGALGYTARSLNHVQVVPGNDLKYDKTAYDRGIKGVQIGARKPEEKPFSGDGNSGSSLYTYLHEVGHQVDFKSELVDRRSGRSALPSWQTPTRYGTTNTQEAFAESFALYMIHGEKFAKSHPEAAAWVKERLDWVTTK